MKQLKCMGLTVLISIISCTKQEPNITDQPQPSPITPLASNEEISWGLPWHKNLRGYEIDLSPAHLTDSAIHKGIDVGVAMYTEMTTFETLPSTIYEYTQMDSVQLSYVASPGRLQIIAQASFDLTYMSAPTYLSDVRIRYH